MILGQGLVWLAVVSAAAAALSAATRARASDSVGPRLLVLSAVALSGALAVLAGAFASEDWTLAYVADHTRSGLDPLIRIAGVWAGAEGSLLLWATMLAWVAVGSAVGLGSAAGDGSGGRQQRWAVAIGAGVVACYAALVAVVASPFETLPVPAIDGLGLQPVLEYPAMVWHPPILYAGLVGLASPAITASASILAGHGPYVAKARLMIPMGLLTIGLVTGAIWANVELGWGGYWAWDPIESAGLVAWLAGAAALHTQAERSPSRPQSATQVIGSARLLALTLMAPGIAAVWATTLTRIGVVSSVHAFADRPALRTGLLIVAAVITVVLLLVGLVAPAPAASLPATSLPAASLPVTSLPGTSLPVAVSDPPSQTPSSSAPKASALAARRSAMGVLAAATVFVAVGTYEPLIEAATTGDAVAIAGRYYTRLLWPLIILGAGLVLRADRRWRPALIGGAIALASTPATAGPFALALAAGGGAVAASALSLVRTRRPGAVAHVGVGLVLVGVAGTVATTTTVVEVAAGATANVDGMAISHRGIELTDGNNTVEAVATVVVDEAVLQPRLVAYELRGVSTAEVAAATNGFDEIQVLLLDGDADGARYRINRLPRVRLVWLGAAVLACGLLVQPWRRFRANSSDSVEGSSSGDGDDGGDVGDDGGLVGGVVGPAETGSGEPV